MKLREIILAEKRITSFGQWKAGLMPRNAFPLSKSGNKAYRLGNRNWRVVEFEALRTEMRLLITFSPGLGQYQATLGVWHQADLKVIAQLERHPTHKGWHVHAGCDDLGVIPAGIRRGPWVRNLCSGCELHWRPSPAGMSEEDAYKVAFQAFKLYKTAPLELVSQ